MSEERVAAGSTASAAIEAAPLSLPLDVCQALVHDLPRAGDRDAALRCIDGVRRRLLGDGLLTVNIDASPADAQHPAGGDTIELQRVWTSDAAAYPVGGRKRKTLTPWTRQLLRDARMFVGEGDAVLREVFDDHALIASLGLRAIVNVPLLDAHGRCAATFNLLGPRPVWQPHELALVQLLALLATPWVVGPRGPRDA